MGPLIPDLFVVAHHTGTTQRHRSAFGTVRPDLCLLLGRQELPRIQTVGRELIHQLIAKDLNLSLERQDTLPIRRLGQPQVFQLPALDKELVLKGFEILQMRLTQGV